MRRIEDFLKDVGSVAIAGHVNPDGDCVGACMGTYIYLRENFPLIPVEVYLEPSRESFAFIKHFDEAKDRCVVDGPVDLCILLDISSRSRIGVAGALAESAKQTLCIDHHITNQETYSWLFNEHFASSTCEVLYHFFEPEKISAACAEALYMGIAHDTGVFQYSGTSPETMRIAASLMEKGIDITRILDETYFCKSYEQNQMLARALLESYTLADGRLIVSAVSREMMEFYGVGPQEMEGIVERLRNTAGVEAAVFLYETEPDTYKVSLRSREAIDVSVVSAALGGGGHRRAAGCTLEGSQSDVIRLVTDELQKQLKNE